MILRRTMLAAALGALLAGPALAGESWDQIRSELFGDAVPATTPGVVSLQAPYRTTNDLRTIVGAEVRAPAGEFLTKVSLIIDDNPMPVSAVFDLAEPRARFAFTGTMRINGPSHIRVVAETESGTLYMQEAFLKTSGVGACAAPPGTDPAIAMETLGQMELGLATGTNAESLVAALGGNRALPASGTGAARMAELSIRHPSNSGMQMDQITLLYIPARFVETVEVGADGKPLFTLTGSISLSENPAFSFSLPDGASVVDVKMTDTDGAVFERSFPLVSG